MYVNVLAFQVKNTRTSALDLCGQASEAHYIALVTPNFVFLCHFRRGDEERERALEKENENGRATKNRDEME